MVNVLIGDIFESKAQTLINTVNCVGIMGKGIALQFKEHFPEMYEDYVKRCKAGDVKLGQPYLYRRLTEPWVLNFPTKDHWRSVSRLQDITRGLDYLERHYLVWGISSLAVPPLGCGQGQLEWRVVGPTLYRYLNRLSIPVEIYAPYGTPHEELHSDFLGQVPEKPRIDTPFRIDPAWIAVVATLAKIEREPYHWPVGRTTFQKITYFATESGIPTGLEYRRGSFGPHAPELKRQITKLVNNGLIYEERLGRMLGVKIGSTFEDALKSYKGDIEKWHEIIQMVADLFMRMRTQQAEIAATVHFAAKSLAGRAHGKLSEKDVLAEVMRWKQKRRPPMYEVEVALAIRNLSMLGWLNVKASTDLPVTEESLLDA